MKKIKSSKDGETFTISGNICSLMSEDTLASSLQDFLEDLRDNRDIESFELEISPLPKPKATR